MVTAEAALVLPVLVCLSVALAWLVLAGVAQLAPGPASWEVTEHGGLVLVTVRTSVRPRLPLLGDLPEFGLSSDAAAAREPDE